MEAPHYAVFLFPSVSHALKAEKILKEQGIVHKLRDQAAGALQGLVTWVRMVLL
jgi:hypothetical protein